MENENNSNSNDLTLGKATKKLKNRRKTHLTTRECSPSSYTEVVTIVDSDEEVPSKNPRRLSPSMSPISIQSGQKSCVDPRGQARKHPLTTGARQTIHTIDNEDIDKGVKIGRKRKASHQSLKVNDEMSFETCIIKDVSPSFMKESKSNNTTSDSTQEMTIQKPWTRMTDNSEPNAEIMKKVAFLRTCVNYMMCHLRMRPYNFRKPASLPWLMSRYNKQKEIQDQNEADLGR